MEITVISIIWRNGAVSYALTTVVCLCQVKYFVDHFKATCHYKRNNTNNSNKITNTALYQNKTKSTWWLLNSSECETHIYSEARRFYDCLSLADEYILYINALTQQYLDIRCALS